MTQGMGAADVRHPNAAPDEVEITIVGENAACTDPLLTVKLQCKQHFAGNSARSVIKSSVSEET
jgi:hypothetical protein